MGGRVDRGASVRMERRRQSSLGDTGVSPGGAGSPPAQLCGKGAEFPIEGRGVPRSDCCACGLERSWRDPVGLALVRGGGGGPCVTCPETEGELCFWTPPPLFSDTTGVCGSHWIPRRGRKRGLEGREDRT